MAKQAPKVVNENQPVHTVRHRSLKASIWRNETDKGVMYNVMLVRSYRENDVWHDSHSFSYDDLMNAAKLLYDAHSYITAERARGLRSVHKAIGPHTGTSPRTSS